MRFRQSQDAGPITVERTFSRQGGASPCGFAVMENDDSAQSLVDHDEILIAVLPGDLECLPLLRRELSRNLGDDD